MSKNEPKVDPPCLLTLLEKFDRKERTLLFTRVTSNYQRCRLSDGFRKTLESTFREIGKIPTDAFVAFDYPFNWLHAALRIHACDWEIETPFPNEEIPSSNGRSAIERNQEDIDLIAAWKDESDDVYEILLIEAKAYSGWTNKQMKSKVDRLKLVFEGSNPTKVRPHFALTSLKESTNLEPLMWPNTRHAAPHILLDEPRLKRLKLEQSTKDGAPLKTGGHHRVFELEYKQD